MKLELSALKTFLEAYDFECALQPASELFQEQLFLSIGQDDAERPLLLQLRLYREPLASVDEGDEKSDLYFLSFFLGLPFEVKETLFGDLARVILMMNKAAPFSAFGLSEADKIAYFSHVLTSKNEEIDPDLLLAHIAIAIYFVRTFAPIFEEVATGKKSAEIILNEAKEYLGAGF